MTNLDESKNTQSVNNRIMNIAMDFLMDCEFALMFSNKNTKPAKRYMDR